jgi:hypothetical protein
MNGIIWKFLTIFFSFVPTFVFLRVLRGNAFDVPITAMTRDDGDLGNPLSLCHSERWRSNATAREEPRG